jgi:hypothetical protein
MSITHDMGELFRFNAALWIPNDLTVPITSPNDCFLTYDFFRKKYLRQPSIDIDFCNLSSSGDVQCSLQGTLVTLTQAGLQTISSMNYFDSSRKYNGNA